LLVIKQHRTVGLTSWFILRHPLFILGDRIPTFLGGRRQDYWGRITR